MQNRYVHTKTINKGQKSCTLEDRTLGMSLKSGLIFPEDQSDGKLRRSSETKALLKRDGRRDEVHCTC